MNLNDIEAARRRPCMRRVNSEAYYTYVEKTDNPDESGPTKIAL